VSRVTSKLQVTIPKAIAERYRIKPGQEIDWLQAGEAIRVVPQTGHERRSDPVKRVALFDRGTARQRSRESEISRVDQVKSHRGWAREELYSRGEPR
jgi:AbrB family looped-hinge helix DNA binding protein